MEARKITVVQTKNQRKSVIMSAATTLGELKTDLRNNGIDYTDMSFFEGVSRTELKTDASILPHNVPYKGQITNELVFMLTNTNKKIKSGANTMSRAEAYEAIKSMGLQDACVKKFGKNFTMCKTADLLELIQSNSNSKPATAVPKAETKAAVEAIAPTGNDGKCIDKAARAAIIKLIDILEDNGTIEEYEEDEVFNLLNEKAITASSSKECTPNLESSYSEDEINDMLLDMDID